MYDDILSGYADWVEEMIAGGMKAHFVTFMFNPLRGGTQAKRTRMEDAITETYSRILTRTVRNPKAEKNRGHLPIIIAAFDLPVFKYDKDHLADIAINDGLHVHGIWMMPRKTRLEGDLSGEFLNHQRRYAGPGRPISRIVSERIEKTPGRVTEYMLKTIGHGRMDLDGVIILPRSRRELSFTELTTSPL